MSDNSDQTESLRATLCKPSAKAAVMDGAVYVDKDGNVSNWELAEQMLEGVDELAFQQASAAQWIKDGHTPESAYFSLGLTKDGKALREA